MPSKPPERRAIGYMIPERRLEVGWRREMSRITFSDCFLATVVGLSTLGTFFTHTLERTDFERIDFAVVRNSPLIGLFLSLCQNVHYKGEFVWAMIPLEPS